MWNCHWTEPNTKENLPNTENFQKRTYQIQWSWTELLNEIKTNGKCNEDVQHFLEDVEPDLKLLSPDFLETWGSGTDWFEFLMLPLTTNWYKCKNNIIIQEVMVNLGKIWKKF